MFYLVSYVSDAKNEGQGLMHLRQGFQHWTVPQALILVLKDEQKFAGGKRNISLRKKSVWKGGQVWHVWSWVPFYRAGRWGAGVTAQSSPLLADLPWLLPEINHFSLLHPMPLCIFIKILAAKATTPMKTFSTVSLLSRVPAPSHYLYKLFERRVSLVPRTAPHHTG